MSEGFPLISICIPIYNRLGIIPVTLQSALSQDYPNFEVVISDNCSDDGTYEWLSAYAMTDSRIRLVRLTQNEGPVRNWQNCLTVARGNYIKFLWSDDFMCPTFLSDCMALFNDRVGFVYSSVRFFETDLSTLSPQTRYALAHKGHYVSAAFIKSVISGEDFPVSGSCALFRRSSVVEALFMEIMPNPYGLDFNKNGAGPDALMFLVAAREYSNFGHIPTALCYFGTGFGSISLSQGRRLRPFYYFAFRYFLENTYPICLSRLKTLGFFELCLWHEEDSKAQYRRIVEDIVAPIDYMFGVGLVLKYLLHVVMTFLGHVCRCLKRIGSVIRRASYV
jgi:glycosyltransferase involved in cell wall biosynthesis